MVRLHRAFRNWNAFAGPAPCGILILLALVAATPALADEAVSSNPDPMQLMEADRAFAALTTAEGASGWASFFQSDGVMFPETGRIDGREAIEAFMTPALMPDGPQLRWDPTDAVIAHSADIGWTLGRWQLVANAGSDAEEILGSGNYVTLWTKDDAGEWKVAVDIGNDDLAVEP